MVTEEVTQEDPEDEPETDEQEAEPTAEVAAAESTSAPKQPTNEMKVVIVMKGENVLLGVQAPDCDPVYTTMKGDLTKALKKVPKLVTEAKQKWEATPRYPKANLPEPPPAPAQVRTSTAAKTTKPAAQPSMF